VIIDKGAFGFVFRPLFTSWPNAHSGSLTIHGTLGVERGRLTLAGAGSLRDGELTGISVKADQVGAENGEMIIRDDAKLVNSGNGFIGYRADSTGAVTVTGERSMWMNEGALTVGGDGTGVLSIADGAVVSNDRGFIAGGSGSTGAVTVTGERSMWMNDSIIAVGGHGTGTLSIASGGHVTNNFAAWIGDRSGSTGSVTVTGKNTTWINTGLLDVGAGGMGVVSITNGAHVSSYDAVIGDISTGAVTVTGVNSIWANNDILAVGANGMGTL
jgi:T5SS/PEP-CTERM-associated repeat protein